MKLRHAPSHRVWLTHRGVCQLEPPTTKTMARQVCQVCTARRGVGCMCGDVTVVGPQRHPGLTRPPPA
eukprot:364505-Chlamydomonas_euryale.AAC.10